MKKFKTRGPMNRAAKFFLAPLIAVLGLLSSPSAYAEGPKEFFLNSAGLELFGGSSRISLAPGFNYGFYPWLQAGGSLSYQSMGFAEDGVNTFTLSLGPTFNLDPAYASSTFIFFGLALRKGSGEVLDPADDPSGTGIAFIVGRRIPIMGTISYRPSAGLQLAGKMTFVVNAFAVSYLF